MRLATLALVLATAATFLGTAPARAQAPTEAMIGIYVNRMPELDLRSNRFDIDFWIWFRWQGDAVDPLSTFEVVDGHIEERWPDVREVVEGWNYGATRVIARLQHHFDVADFPFDAHRLVLRIEDNAWDINRLTYTADNAASGLDPAVTLPGFATEYGGADVVTREYHTNYGNPAHGSSSTYSSFRFYIDVARPGQGYFWKLLWGSFLATLIGLATLLIRTSDASPRFALGAGALFAAVANAYVISRALPETPAITLAERYSMLAVAFVFAAIIVSLASLQLHYAGRSRASRRLDLSAAGVLFVAYVGASAILG